MLSSILGWIATIIFSIMLIPQLIVTIKTKTVKGTSSSLFYLYFIGNIIALVYAFLIKQPPLFFKYSIALILSGYYLIIYEKIRKIENDSNK